MTAPVKAAVRGHNEALFGTKPPGSQWADRKAFFLVVHYATKHSLFPLQRSIQLVVMLSVLKIETSIFAGKVFR